MDSDDDYQSFSPPKEASPQPHYRRLKRLKNSDAKPSKEALPELVDDPLLFPHVDFARLEAMENDSEFPEFDNDLNSSEELNFSQESLSRGEDDEDEMGQDDTTERDFKEEGRKTKRVLDFGLDAAGGEDGNEGEIGEGGDEGFELKKDKEAIGDAGLLEEKDNKKKKSKAKSDTGDKSETNVRRSSKRREKKERKTYLEQLHAESQRVLRETRNASFKPIPMVHKPISSVLEKIRKRKLEISKKAMAMNDSCLSEGGFNSVDKLMELDESIDDRNGENVVLAMEKEVVAPPVDVVMNLAASGVDECKDSSKQTNQEIDQNKESPMEELTPAFRAPVDDTQDLFGDSEPDVATVEPHGPSQEEFSPSLLPMHLKFDSVPMDDSSSDEEDNDKENFVPDVIGGADFSSSPNGDPVKDFVDDEAEEEDDSDHDLLHTQENAEEEDVEDFEELAHMIATDYKEKPIDNERRNELHQNWLQQQDAAGTDKIMQRLGCGSGLQHALLQDKEPETDEEEEGSDDEASEDSMAQNSVRMNTKKAKELILQFLSEKEDAYLSDDDDDKQRRHAQYVIRNEEQSMLVPPAEDESSREVFGLIKKTNIAPDQKKRLKPPSFFDSVLKGGSTNNSSKSFLGRSSNLPVKSAKRLGSGAVRHFIFGRDDSNSRSSISALEDSSETVSHEVRQTRTITAKYTSSQMKVASQTRNAATETVSRTSLLDILKRPSPQSQTCNQETTIDLTKSIFTFRAPKKPMKVEGRS